MGCGDLLDVNSALATSVEEAEGAKPRPRSERPGEVPLETDGFRSDRTSAV